MSEQEIPSWDRMYRNEAYSWFWPPAFDPNQPPAELPALLKLLAPPAGGRILDLACGLGWLTIPLAQSGYQVTGFDLSAPLLTRAEAAAAAAGVEVAWERGDMRRLPAGWTGAFDAVTFTLSEFGCFADPADNQRVLTEAARVLKPGGRFLLDIVVNRDNLVQRGETINYLSGDGYYVIEQGSFDVLSGIHRRVFRWYYQGEHHETRWQIQTYTPTEVARMLAAAGLAVRGAYANLAGDPLTGDSTGMLFVTDKVESGSG